MSQVKGFSDTIKWYDQNAKQYAKASSSNANPEQINQFADLLPSHAVVLDAGCGPGRDTQLLAEKGLDVIGLDLSKGLIQTAKETYPQLKFVIGDLLNLPFPSDTFDGIWSHASLVHLETVNDVKKALKEFYRVVKPNGVIHVLVKAQLGKEKTAIVSDAISHHDRFFQYFTQDELTSLLKSTGFTLIASEQYKEIDRHPNARPEVEWIVTLSRKS